MNWSQMVEAARFAPPSLREMNPNHDPTNGEFSSGGGGSAQAAATISKLLKPDVGATIDPRTGESPTKGYAVAGLREPTLRQSGDLTQDDIRSWMDDNASILARPGMMIGLWTNDAGLTYLEPSEVMDDRDQAIQAGTDRNQEGIADLAAYSRGEDGFIATGGDGTFKGIPKGYE